MTATAKEFILNDGHTFLITFTDEGLVYDLLDKDGEVVEEYGYDFYEDFLPKGYKHQS